MAETTSPEAAPAPKFSRYRSVRRAQQQHQEQQQVEQLPTHKQQEETTPPVPAIPPIPAADMPSRSSKDALVSRSMSRYHRRPTTAHAPAPKSPPTRSTTELVPPISSSTSTQTANSAIRSRALSSPQHAAHKVSSAEPRLPNTSRFRGEIPPLIAKGEREPAQNSREEAKQLLQKEAERQRRMQEKIQAERRARVEAEEAERRARLEAEEAERKKQEQLKREAEEAEQKRIQKEAEEAEKLRREKEEQLRREKEEHERRKKLHKAESAARLKKREEEARRARPASPPASPPRHGVAAGFNMFSRRRKDDVPASPESLPNTGRPRQASDGKDQDLTTIRPGGGGAVLNIDAPISAVNAGDRRVMVVRNEQHIYLPVTTTTTPLDLLKSASNVLSEPIDVRTAVILESFHKVGVKRPLRNYEHVRDVMNSWDDDNQNDLLIIDSREGGVNQHELLASQVPDSKPAGRSFYIHYSSKPGSWSKRYVTLQQDGRLLMSKSEGSKKEDSICHLSDFDIYKPTDRKLSKIKPPKKICYAVKSQQKSNIFTDESRFVHFFCTNDQDTGSLFYRSLHGWRSWYLKHVMGEGQARKTLDPKVSGPFLTRNNAAITSEQNHSHTRGESVSSHYQLGTFSDLLDLSQFTMDSKDKEDNYRPGAFPDDAPLSRLNSRAIHARKMSTRRPGNPPLSTGMKEFAVPPVPRQNSLTQSNHSDPEKDPFSSAGLLGRTYSQRQRAAQEREQKATPSGPFTEGPSLLNSMNFAIQTSSDTGLNRRASVRSTHHRTSSDLHRSMSNRAMPRPLVDLTPQYKEPPQHARKGRGFIPEGASGPLIENATSVEEAIKVPSSTDWRARPSTSRAYGTNNGNEATKALKGRGEALAAYAVNNHENVPEDSNSAFTGGGLLARAKFSQGHTPVGHGVMDGSKARGPMLDMREDSKFAQGSLLASVNRAHAGPVIDRDKRRSMDWN